MGIFRILFFKMESDDYSVLKTFLVYLDHMPDVVELINGRNLINSDIPIIKEVAARLTEL